MKLEPRNITLLEGAHVRKIILARASDGSSYVAAGVEYEKDGKVQVITACREVIVSAGG